MTEITLTTLVDGIVEICNAATALGEQLTGQEIFDAAAERYPSASPALIKLAFPRAAARLHAEADRCFAEADALERYREARRN